jgi:hypothetical protein
MRELHVNLSADAANVLRGSGSRNANGVSLHSWLTRSFATLASGMSNPSLFAETLQVDDDVPLLLEALATVTGQKTDELVEAWLMQPPGSEAGTGDPATVEEHGALPDETIGKIADVLDMGETLFEETVCDARRKLGGSYPDGDRAARTGAEVFRALRLLVGIPTADDDQPPDEQKPSSSRPSRNRSIDRAPEGTRAKG